MLLAQVTATYKILFVSKEGLFFERRTVFYNFICKRKLKSEEALTALKLNFIYR